MLKCPTCQGLGLKSVSRRHTHKKLYWEVEKSDEYWDEEGNNHEHQVWRQYFRCDRGHLFTWRNSEPCRINGCDYQNTIGESWIGHHKPANAGLVTAALDQLLKAFEPHKP